MRTFTAFLIDDDPDDQLFFEMASASQDTAIVCEFASDCELALEKLKDPSFKPNIIFIDINISRMNGVECLRAIKKNARLSDVTIYMYSTAPDAETGKTCLRPGASGVVKKLPGIELLRKRLLEIFSELKLLQPK